MVNQIKEEDTWKTPNKRRKGKNRKKLFNKSNQLVHKPEIFKVIN